MAKTNKIRNSFGAVSIVPNPQNCCEAIEKYAGIRLLIAEVPLLPIDGCDRYDKCACKYGHWDDRRQDSRREFDKSFARQFFYEDEKRSLRRGRRITD